MTQEKAQANLAKQKANQKRLKFLRALFERKLTKRNHLEVSGYSGPVGERG